MQSSEYGTVLVKIECTPACNEGIKKILGGMKLPEGISAIRDDFHCTLMFSRRCKGPEPTSDLSQTIVVKPSGFEQFGEAIVLVLDDREGKFRALHERVQTLHEAMHAYADYTPHTTLFYVPNKTLSRQELDALFDQWPKDATLVFEEVRSKRFVR